MHSCVVILVKISGHAIELKLGLDVTYQILAKPICYCCGHGHLNTHILWLTALGMIMKHEILFAHIFLIQTHHYLPNWRINFTILEQKISSCVAILVDIFYGHRFSLLQDIFEVQINS